jgi:dolichol-phosphate mannosyltransferase
LKISIITPTFNERDNIAPLIDEISRALGGTSFEIILSDDDSPDRTWELASEIAVSDARVRVIRRTSQRGLGASVIDGFTAARGELVACIDADLQHDPSALPQMLDAVMAGADVAIGSRYVDGGSTGNWTFARRMISRVATRMAQSFLGIELSDPMSGYFIMRRSDFVKVQAALDGRGFKILLEILAELRPRKISEVPYTFRTRHAGNSKLNGTIIFQYVAQLWRLSRKRSEDRVTPEIRIAPRKIPTE